MSDLTAMAEGDVIERGTGLLLREPEQFVTGGRRGDRDPAAVYLARLSSGSRPAMARALDVMAQIVTDDEEADRDAVPWHALRYPHAEAIRAVLAVRYAHSTANKMLSALRQTLKAAWKLGLMSAEAYQQAASVENVRGETVPAGRAVAGGELVALLDTCDQKPQGIRDAAILSLLYSAGLRRAEVVGLNIGDYDRDGQRLLVRGKRNKQRSLPIVAGAASALADWLAIRGAAPGPLFWGVGNRNRGGRLTTQAVYKMLQTRARAAGIQRLSPHDFRRTFVGDLLDAGADIVTVQKLAGHADVTTTARYDRRGEQAKRKAVDLLHVPYRRRVLREESG